MLNYKEKKLETEDHTRRGPGLKSEVWFCRTSAIPTSPGPQNCSPGGPTSQLPLRDELWRCHSRTLGPLLLSRPRPQMVQAEGGEASLLCAGYLGLLQPLGLGPRLLNLKAESVGITSAKIPDLHPESLTQSWGPRI